MKATQPDNKGHFGKYGGMYVLERRLWSRSMSSPAYSKKRRMILCLRRSFALFTGVCRPPHSTLFSRADDGGPVCRSDLSQARRSLPYQRAQD